MDKATLLSNGWRVLEPSPASEAAVKALPLAQCLLVLNDCPVCETAVAALSTSELLALGVVPVAILFQEMNPKHLAEMDRWRLRGAPQSRFYANGRLLGAWQGLAPEACPEDVRAFNQAWLARQLTAAFVEAPGGDLPAAVSDQ
jgi:hypothetical protein